MMPKINGFHFVLLCWPLHSDRTRTEELRIFVFWNCSGFAIFFKFASFLVIFTYFSLNQKLAFLHRLKKFYTGRPRYVH